MKLFNTHWRRPRLTHPGRNGRRFALAVIVPLLAIVWLSARVDPTQAQSSPNGSVPIDKGLLTVAGDVQPNRDVTFAAAVAGPTTFAADLRGDATVGPRTVTAGAYTIALTGTQSGDYNTAFSCTVDGAAGPSGNGRSAAVTVGKDEDVICTFTHTRKTGRITVALALEGGSASHDQWTFAVTGAGLTGLRAGTPVDVPTGVYAVAAGGPAAYRLVDATGVCRIGAGGVNMSVAEGGGTCTLRYRAAALRLVEAYGVSRVQEGQLTGVGSSSCYRIVSSVPPVGNVEIQLTHDDQLTVQPAGPITLNQSNWNRTDDGDVSNRVCVRAVDDAVDEPNTNQCKNRTVNADGGGDSGMTVCGDAVSFVGHAVATSDDLAFNAGTPFTGNTLRDLDNDAATVDVLVGDNDTARIIIQEAAGVTVVDEGAARAASYTVALASQPRDNVVVRLTWDRAQLQVTPAQLTFTPATWATPQTVTVRAVDDLEDDPEQPTCHPVDNGAEVCGDYRVVIEHTIESNDTIYRTAAFQGNGPTGDVNPRQVPVLIRDNDRAGLQVDPPVVSLLEGDRAGVTVALRTRPTTAVAVTIEDPAVAVTAFRPDNRAAVTLAFTPDNWNVAQQVMLVESDNDVADGLRRRTPRIALASSDPHYATPADTALQLEITDDDSPGVLTNAASVSVTEGGAPVTYTLQLTSRPAATVTVAITTGGRSVIEPARVSFTPATWDAPQPLTVRAVDDDVAHEDVLQDVAQHVVASQDENYVNLPVRTVTITIVDNDAAAVLLDAAPGLTVPEGGRVAYGVRLQTRPNAPVQVTVAPPALLAAQPMTLTFTAENWAQAQTVTLTAAEDHRDTPQDRLPVTVNHVLTGGDAAYLAADSPALQVEILDNDHASLLFSTARLALDAGETGAYSLVLASQPSAPVLVLLTPSAALRVQGECPVDEVESACVLFTAETWSIPQTVTVTARTTTPQSLAHTVVSNDPAYDGATATLRVDAGGPLLYYLPLITRMR